MILKKLHARKHCTSMSNGFGKSGMSMHVSCVILKDPTNHSEGEECQSLKKMHTHNIHWQSKSRCWSSVGYLLVSIKASKKQFSRYKLHHW